ncbi:unnamed protein product [Chondrus crispus]|uniref:Uncharacterized protein n=1 Tax=Chondrus crispus TaxID=2769 RepID=R7QBS3_CHOCR|nr:unnamed protein product [Chondrus crispus]CDF34881.1 unnamed protein product [Chondrus crispus]|eukprot:XP_005714700.1 unnamed protein product [Chondrus crispus]
MRHRNRADEADKQMNDCGQTGFDAQADGGGMLFFDGAVEKCERPPRQIDEGS